MSNIKDLIAWSEWRATFDKALRNGLKNEAFKLYPPDNAATRTIERATKQLKAIIANVERKE